MHAASDIFVPGFAERLAEQWGRGPRIFRDALRAPALTERELMSAILGTAADYLADPGVKVPPGRVFLAGEVVKPEQLASFLPRGGAEDCTQYVSRIRQAHPQEEIGIILDNCEKHIGAVRDRLTPVLHGLFSRVGYPARQNHACIYAGTYRTTPFGIHRDDCHVLMFCGLGKKKMAFWPRPYFDEKKHLHVQGKLRASVPEHISQATVLEIGPLDALYWSSDDWHVAVSEGDEFQAALSVGIYHHGSSTEKLQALDFLVTLARGSGLDLPGLPGAPEGRLDGGTLSTGPMAAFFEQWEQLRATLSRPGEAEYRALNIALRLISSAGYGKLAARPAGDLRLDGRLLQCAVPQALVVARTRDGLLVGANGSVFLYERGLAAIEKTVLALRRAEPVRCADVIASVEESAQRVIASVLQDLANSGALAVLPAAGDDAPAPA
jgi:hypothetical protein